LLQNQSKIHQHNKKKTHTQKNTGLLEAYKWLSESNYDAEILLVKDKDIKHENIQL